MTGLSIPGLQIEMASYRLIFGNLSHMESSKLKREISQMPNADASITEEMESKRVNTLSPLMTNTVEEKHDLEVLDIELVRIIFFS
ncbi:hypothetical protein Ancab_031954 [Ancistrocladus abbreviatus]